MKHKKPITIVILILLIVFVLLRFSPYVIYRFYLYPKLAELGNTMHVIPQTKLIMESWGQDIELKSVAIDSFLISVPTSYQITDVNFITDKAVVGCGESESLAKLLRMYPKEGDDAVPLFFSERSPVATDIKFLDPCRWIEEKAVALTAKSTLFGYDVKDAYYFNNGRMHGLVGLPKNSQYLILHFISHDYDVAGTLHYSPLKLKDYDENDAVQTLIRMFSTLSLKYEQ